MCHESSGVGLGETIGVGKGTVSLDDFDLADAIFVIGQNPGTNHPRMLSALEDRRAAVARIVSVNPLHEPGLDRFAHPQHVGGSSAGHRDRRPVPPRPDQRRRGPAQGDHEEVLEDERAAPGEVLDQAFIAEHTVRLRGVRRGPRGSMRSAGSRRLGSSGDRASAERLRSRRPGDRLLGDGAHPAQERGREHQEVVNLLLLRGNLGRPGAGVCPVRGHSNVQGDRTMGI